MSSNSGSGSATKPGAEKTKSGKEALGGGGSSGAAAKGDGKGSSVAAGKKGGAARGVKGGKDGEGPQELPRPKTEMELIQERCNAITDDVWSTSFYELLRKYSYFVLYSYNLFTCTPVLL